MSEDIREFESCDRDDTPADINEAVQNVVINSLPEKSGHLYKQCYKQFLEWQRQRDITSYSEETMLLYFTELSKKLKPSSLWAKYSMLKCTVINSQNVDIGQYRQLSKFMTSNSKGFVSTKSNVFEPKDVERFLTEAPDNRYLAIKVALILGITGACRREELKNITIHDVEHYDNMMIVKIRRTRNDVPRKFTVTGEFYEIIKKYVALRPKDVPNDRFFLCLRDGKCTQQVIGINTFGAMPKIIAEYLQLEDPDKYTGHSFRRTSATMLANAGADLLTLKRHGGWKSNRVAMGYVEDSLTNKKNICSSVDLDQQSSSNFEKVRRKKKFHINEVVKLPNVLSKQYANLASIENEHLMSPTVSNINSNEEQMKLTKEKDYHKANLMQLMPNAKPENMGRKRKISNDSELPCKIVKIKEETPVIDVTDDSDFDGTSDNNTNSDSDINSSDEDSDSSNSDDNTHSNNTNGAIFVVTVDKTPFLMEIPEKISMENLKRMFKELKNTVRLHDIPRTENVINFSCKKRKKTKHKKKAKTRKNRKVTTTGNKFTLPHETEVKKEYVEENQSEKLNNLNFTSEPMEFVRVKDEFASSHCNIAASLIENVDSTGSWVSVRRYEDEMDNGDLDDYEATLNIEMSSLEELNSNMQIINQPDMMQIDGAGLDHVVKYEPEMAVSEEEEESIYRPSNNSSIIPVEMIKSEPVELDPKTSNCGIDSAALDVDATINLVSVNSEPAVIKHETVEEEPKPDNSENCVIVLSDDENDDEIKDKLAEDVGEILNSSDDLSKDTEIWNSSDEDIEYHETRRNNILEEIRKLTYEEERKRENEEEDSKKESSDSLVSSKQPVLSSETADKEIVFNDIDKNRINENNSRKKESLNKTKSNDEKNSCEKKRSHDRSNDKETSNVKKKCIDESSRNKKSSNEKISRDETKCQVEKRSKERKSDNEQKSTDEKISKSVKKELLDGVAKSDEEVSNSCEHKAESNKQSEKRRYSSEAKSGRISDSNNDSNRSNEFPLVDDLRQSPSIIESPNLATNECNTKEINKSSNKSEKAIATTSNIESLESNSREIPSTKESIVSKSAIKPNDNLSVKSETETKHGLRELIRQCDGGKSVFSHGNKTFDEEAFNELVQEMTMKKFKKFAEELFTAKVEFKLTVEPGGKFQLNDQEDEIAKLAESALTNEHCEQHENVDEIIGGKKQKDISADLGKEKDRTLKEKSEKTRTSDVDGKESITDCKAASPANRSNSSRNETRKSLDSAKENLPKAGTSGEGVGNSSFNIEQKPVASFVGRIPKKSATQNNEHPAEQSPINESPSQSQQTLYTDAKIVTEARKSKTKKIIHRTEVDTKTSLNLEQFLQRIFQWNPAWLKKKPYLNATRKVVDEENLCPMRPIYESYDEYYSDAERLLALEIWHGMTSEREIESMNAKNSLKFSIVGRSVNTKKFPSTNIEMTTLLLDVVISKREAQTQSHPVIGDLIFFEYLPPRQESECLATEVFAYVTNVRSNIISANTRFNRDLLNFAPDHHTLLTYTVLTKYIHHSEIQTGRVFQMTTVPYFRPNMRGILALQQFSESPLLNMILHPKVEDYQLESENLENYSLVTGDTLNSKQKEAVATITETVVKKIPKISLVQGPPGTGKTKVITNIITQIIYGDGRYEHKPVFRVLVCAPSNAAADEIVTRLLEQRRMFEKGKRFNMVRVGRREVMHQNVQDVSLADLTDKELHRFIQTCRNSPPGKIQDIKEFHERQITKFEKERTKATNADAKKQIARKIEDIRTKYDFVLNPRSADQLDRRELDALRRVSENTLLVGAHVIVGTPVACCSTYMEALFANKETNPISVCIVDEATKTCEADTLLLLSSGVKSLVLVGDALQQPATNLPNKSSLCVLNQSLFARVQQAFVGYEETNPTIRFDTQYRMSHPVAYWPQEYFYADTLYSAANLPPLPVHSYKVINLDSKQDHDLKPAMTNQREALFVACIIYTLATRAKLENFNAPIRVGVITPYHKQKEMIKEKIKSRLERLPPVITHRINYDVNTIDGIQGQERDVIIMSCVRSNGIGILADRQRVWLALTRAKQSMIICGNFQAFESDPMWNELLSDAKSRGAYANVRWNAMADEVKTHVVR